MKKIGITLSEEQFIRDNYFRMTAKEIGNELGMTRSKVKNHISRLGLKLSEDDRKARQSRGMFKPGNVPHTKGKRMHEFMSEETILKFRANQFKKGNIPHNTKEDGHITIRRNSDGILYKWIRKSQSCWELLHRALWEANHGLIPDNMVVRFIDGNQMNCIVENLELIMMSDHLQRNKIEWRLIMSRIWDENRTRKTQIKFEKTQQREQIRLEKRLKREQNSLQAKKKKEKIQKISDYGSMFINSSDPFYKSINDNFQTLFAMAVTKTKNKELAQDLIHELIVTHYDGNSKTLNELKALLKNAYKSDAAFKNKMNTNEKVFLFISDENSHSEINSNHRIEDDVNAAIRKLNKLDQEIAYQYFIDGISEYDVSESLSIPIDIIIDRIDSISGALRSELHQYDNLVA